MGIRKLKVFLLSLFKKKVANNLNDDLDNKTEVVFFDTTVGHSILPKGAGERYEFKKSLGIGSYGMVQLVKDRRLGRLIAMKCLNKSAQNQQAHDLFLKEAQAVASLGHDNIVIIYDVQNLEEKAYITMEYLADGTLEEKIKKRGVMKESDALVIIKGIMNGVAAVHDKDIIHGDIKPANILFGPKGRPKIVDFGIAPLYRNYKGDRVLGTPVYMAPEQVDNLEDLDGRIDIYSVGLVFFEMLSGERYHKHKVVATVEYMEEFNANRVDNLCSNISKSSRNILKKLLMVNREDRYQKIEEALKDVDENPLSNPERLDLLPQHRRDNEFLLREVMEVLLVEGEESVAQNLELKKRAKALGVSEDRSDVIRKKVLKRIAN